MRHGRTAAADRHGPAPGEERGLTSVTFVGSYPTADFRPPRRLPEIALLGRSNVGKSSLLNAVVGRRSIARTSRTPGKTRLCNVFEWDERLYLVDLPGYGYARVSHAARRAFRALLRDYLTMRETVAGVVWLLDARREPSADDREMGALLVDRGVPVLIAVTKADKLNRATRQAQLAAIADAVGVPEDQCVATSTRTREGIDALREAIEGLART